MRLTMRTSFINKSLSLFFISCALFFVTSSNSFAIETDKMYYTKHNFMYERGRHLTTNYWRGSLVPVNSQVELITLTPKKLVLIYQGQEIEIRNVAKHTKTTTAVIADRLLSRSPVNPTGKFAKEARFGELRLGMTKNEVIMTRGYPPAHKTFSLETDKWVYWSSRFVQHTLVFRNGFLIEGRGIR